MTVEQPDRPEYGQNPVDQQSPGAPAPDVPARAEDHTTFKCHQCGDHMLFDPATQQLRCESCGSLQPVPPLSQESIVEYDFASAEHIDGRAWYTENRVAQCNGCGATTILEKFAISTRCAFCGSTQVTDVTDAPGIHPEAVVPFHIDRQQAAALFKKWLGRRILAPKAVHTEHQPERFQGIYLPYWTYDALTTSDYAGMAGEHYMISENYTVVENGRSVLRTRQVQKTRWFPVSGRYLEHFDDVLVQAETSLEEKMLQRIEPFNLAGLLPYQPGFLSGFAAKSYQVSLKEGFGQAQQKMARAIDSGIRAQVHADELRLTHLTTAYDDITFKHILLPIWISSFRFRGRTYRYLVNGQTGRVHGTYPLSPVRVAIAIILVLLILVLLYWLISYSTGA